MLLDCKTAKLTFFDPKFFWNRPTSSPRQFLLPQLPPFLKSHWTTATVMMMTKVHSSLGNSKERITQFLLDSTSENFVSHDFRRVLPHTRIGRSLKVGTAQFDSNGTLISVPIFGVPTTTSATPLSQSPAIPSSASNSHTTSGVVDLSPTCVEVLAWPLQKYVRNRQVLKCTVN